MTERKGFPLRLDPQLYDELQRWAAAEFRSVNGQIEYLLRCALKEAGRLPGQSRGKKTEDAHATKKKRCPIERRFAILAPTTQTFLKLR